MVPTDIMMIASFLSRMIWGQSRRMSIFVAGINDGIKMKALFTNLTYYKTKRLFLSTKNVDKYVDNTGLKGI